LFKLLHFRLKLYTSQTRYIAVNGYYRVDETQYPRRDKHSQQTNVKFDEELEWGCYARGALYALQRGGHHLTKVRRMFYCCTLCTYFVIKG